MLNQSILLTCDIYLLLHVCSVIIEAVQSPYAATMLESLPPTLQFKNIGEVFPNASNESIDLIRSCFHFNPTRRPSAEELLKHVYVSEFHNEEEEPVYPHGPLRLPIGKFK